MPSSPSLLTEINQRHQVMLERNKSHEVKAFEKYLVKIAKTVRDQLEGNDLTEFSRTRLEKLLTEINKSLNTIYDDYKIEWRGQINDLAKYESEFEIKSLKQVVDYNFAVPSASQVNEAVWGNPLSAKGYQGYLLEPFFDEMTATNINRISGAIRAGQFQGLTTPQIISNLIGTKKANYTDGVVSLSYRDAATITRTALQHAAVQARQKTWEANSDIVKKWKFRATLDFRTSQTCASLDGTEWPLNEGPHPPRHPNCRSSETAVLDDRFSFLREGATRSSRGQDGVESVDANTTYYGWLMKQPSEFQDAAIGTTRAKLLRDGGLSAERFAELNIGRDFQPLRLDEMRELDPVVFDKAGL
ncbi:MAG TPA: phage minor head protein [Nitrosomonas sp.]|nr:phage minor head protein [Nitrosomonas sp.]